MPTLSDKDRTRLVKLMGMLGSAHDGEKANAATFISKMAAEYKLTIVELMALANPASSRPPPPPPPPPPRPRTQTYSAYNSQPRPKPPPPPPPPPPRPKPAPGPRPNIYMDTSAVRDFTDSPILEAVSFVLELFPHILNNFERDFLPDVFTRYEHDYQLSEKQIAVIVRIIKKCPLSKFNNASPPPRPQPPPQPSPSTAEFEPPKPKPPPSSRRLDDWENFDWESKK